MGTARSPSLPAAQPLLDGRAAPPRRRVVEQFHHPGGERLPGGPRPESEWEAALARFTVLTPYGSTCFFSYYVEGIAWSYHRQGSDTSTGECASACLQISGCTGFEFPENGDYCAFWFNGNCDNPSDPADHPSITSQGTSRGSVVVTYVLCEHVLTNCSWVPDSPPTAPPLPPGSPRPPRPPPSPPSPPMPPPLPPRPPAPPEPPWMSPLPSAWLTLTRMSGCKVPSTPLDDSAPPASLDHRKPQAAPTHHGAPPEQLGRLPWPQEPACALPKSSFLSLANRQAHRHRPLRCNRIDSGGAAGLERPSTRLGDPPVGPSGASCGAGRSY